MRLTTVLLIATLMQVSAATLAQKVTISKTNAPLKSILKSIRSQTGYSFFISEDLLKKAAPVTINVKDLQLSDALAAIFNKQPMTYTVEENMILVKQINPMIANLRDTSIRVEGKVLNENGMGLGGANIRIKGMNMNIQTAGNGSFVIVVPSGGAVLAVSYLGYKTKEISISGADVSLTINLELEVTNLEDVVIVSTGYQKLPKERATGSFELINNKQLTQINSPNILSRLEGNTTSMDFNLQLRPTSSGDPQKKSIISNLTIRGSNKLVNNSIAAGGYPLVVIDGVALEDNTAGNIDQDPLNNINPNDVENITLLKDAAAASIWGSRAANGVIVITTKKGRYNQEMQISANANVTVSEKPDLYYHKRASTADFIGIQRFLYGKGFYQGDLDYENFQNFNLMLVKVPEVIEILELVRKNGLNPAVGLTPAQGEAALANLAQNDVRKDFTKYILRNEVNQQYNLNISGGSQFINYRIAGGYDYSLNNVVSSSNNRKTLTSAFSIIPVKNLEVLTNIDYSQINRKDASLQNYISEAANSGIGGSMFDPYVKLADENGNPLPVIKDYRPAYVDTLGNGNLLDMHYYPLRNINAGYTKVNQDQLRLNLQANYKISDAFSVSGIYSYQKLITNAYDLATSDSYSTRRLINLFSSARTYKDPSTGLPVPYHRSLPLGGIYTPDLSTTIGQTFRAQLNFNKTWSQKHALAAIAGAEMKKSDSENTLNTYYGYNEVTKRYNNQLDYGRQDVPTLDGGSSALPYQSTTIDNIQRTLSQFVNVAYTYDNRYTVSGSARRDGSNVFGRSTNEAFSPFYSVGGLWNIANEHFFKVKWLPSLRLRVTFGYNGNVNYVNAPYPQIVLQSSNALNGLPFALLSGVTNQSLRQERTGILNLGLDFGIKGNRLSGSLEYYNKLTTDIISTTPINPTVGVTETSYNSANIRSQGIDLTLNAVLIEQRDFRWTNIFLFSYNKNKVTKVYTNPSLLNPNGVANLGNRVPGYDVNAIFAYKWAGLSSTGAPQYFNELGAASTDYINRPSTGSYEGVVHYIGTATPKYFGAYRNTFSYKNYQLSANLLYKFGYYFRRTSLINYTGAAYNGGYLAAEYADRWQKPGDEAVTNVPAFTYPTNNNADVIYRLADINFLKGDHIRLKEINFSYTFNKPSWRFKNLQISGNIQNLGIIWRANKYKLDPEIFDVPRPRVYSVGLSANY